MMNRINFKPEPEVNQDTILPPSQLMVYPSPTVPGATSVMLVSDDDYREIQGGLRLTQEQVESLFYALARTVGDELFDLGFKAGLQCSEGVA